MSIALDHETRNVRAGNPLTGKVVVEVVRGKVQGHEVRLDVVGREKISTGRAQQDEHEIVRISTVLSDLRGHRLARGKFEYPFSLELPEFLPSSMTSSIAGDGLDRHGCKVVYDVASTLGGLFCDKVFIVQAAPSPISGIPFLVEPKTQIIKAAGVLEKGSVTFGAYVYDSYVGKGEGLKMAIAAINNSTVELRVELKVVERIEWKGSTEKSTNHIKNTLVIKNNVSLPGLRTEKCTRKQVLHEGTVKDRSNRNADAILSSLQTGESVITLTIPKVARDTYLGERMSVSHYVKIKLMTKTRLVENVDTKIPIFIGTPRNEVPTVAQARLVPTIPRFQSEECPIATPIATPIPIPIPIPPDVDSPPSGASSVNNGSLQRRDIEDVGVLPPPTAPTLSNLLAELSNTSNAYDVISKNLNYPAWQHALFSYLSPSDFGSILSHVSSDGPRIASLMAANVMNFTCEHTVQGLRNTGSAYRLLLLEYVLPFCSDLPTNDYMIREELTDWEWSEAMAQFGA